MVSLLIRDAQILCPQGFIKGPSLLIQDRKIHRLSENIPEEVGMKVIDGRGLYLLPGLIDLHLHGAMGRSFEEAEGESLIIISKALAQWGVTGFLPTLTPSPLAQIHKAISFIKEMKDSPLMASKVLGINLEGPFLNPLRAGALNKTHFLKPDLKVLQALLKASEDALKVMTLAPELPGALSLFPLLKEYGVAIAGGHSDATYEEALTAHEAGLSHISHLFNAMRPFHHREPGLVGAALMHEGFSVELIPDGHHLHSLALHLVLNLKGPERVALVSDSCPAMGMPDGSYPFLGQECILKDGSFRQKDTGALAGGASTLFSSIRRLHRQMGLPLDQLLQMASLVPAALLGIHQKKGSIEEGKDADLIIADQELRILKVFIEGQEIEVEQEVNKP